MNMAMQKAVAREEMGTVVARNGRFIVLEGIDGTGKSTVARRLAKHLRETEGREVVLTAEPTGDWLGDCVRRGHDVNLNPLTESLLFVADRCEHTERIRDWVEEGKIVICDRYYASTVAYQGAALYDSMGDAALQWLLLINTPVIMRPDLTILLTCEAEKALDRVNNRGEKSKFEKLEYLRMVQDNYRYLAKVECFQTIDSDCSIDELFAKVLALVKAYV